MTRPEKVLIPLIFAMMTCLPASASAAPIHDASRNGDVAEVKRLLASGADVEARDKYGQTPLHIASYHGHAEVAKRLLSSGADMNAPRPRDLNTPLHLASYNGHVAMVGILLAAGAYMKATNKYWKTPLDLAVERDKWGAVLVLEAWRVEE